MRDERHSSWAEPHASVFVRRSRRMGQAKDLNKSFAEGYMKKIMISAIIFPILILTSCLSPAVNAPAPTATSAPSETPSLPPTESPTVTPVEVPLPVFDQAQINAMTNEEKLAIGPELEGHDKWRASGEYVIYADQNGNVVKAYDLSKGEFRDIPEYPVTTPENFRDSDISVEELFNGDYFLWLEKEAKKLSCSPSMRTDIPMVVWNGTITPNNETAPNFKVLGSEFFIRDHTAALTKYFLPDGQDVDYIVMPLFMCARDAITAKDQIYPIITVASSFDPGAQRTQDQDNILWSSDNLYRWRNDMKTTPIVPDDKLGATRNNVQDPLVAQTFVENPNLSALFNEFISGNFSSLSKPGLVFLSMIGTNRAHMYE